MLVAFFEFCAPSIEEAIGDAVAGGAEKVVVITTMMTPGGSHSEIDIPRSIEAARRRFPNTRIVYAWPYSTDLLVRTFAEQIDAFEAGRP